MINDSMKSNRLVGMIQPKLTKNNNDVPKLHEIGCMGKLQILRKLRTLDI